MILYAEKKHFLDFTSGVRQEVSDTVMVFPVKPDALDKDYQSLQRLKDESTTGTVPCFYCGTEQSMSSGNLKRCGHCKIAVYCNRECQKKHWKGGHRQMCTHFDELLRFSAVNFNDPFDRKFAWGGRAAFLDLVAGFGRAGLDGPANLHNRHDYDEDDEIDTEDNDEPGRGNHGPFIEMLSERSHLGDGLGNALMSETDVTLRYCSICKARKPVSSFSKTQAKKVATARRCKICIQTGRR